MKMTRELLEGYLEKISENTDFTFEITEFNDSEIDLESVFKRMNDSKFSEMKWGELVPTTLHSTIFKNLYHQVDDGKWRLIY